MAEISSKLPKLVGIRKAYMYAPTISVTRH